MRGTISIAALVGPSEQPFVQLAAEKLSRALSEAAGAAWAYECRLAHEPALLLAESGKAIRLTSLLLDADKFDQGWLETEQQLRAFYAKLGESGEPVFICTVLRHVPRGGDPAQRNARLVRIRRLNLLAAEISHQTGACVIDLDRVISDIGARKLGADYRLISPEAAEVAAHVIAETLLSYGLDERVPFEVQDAAASRLTAMQPKVMQITSALGSQMAQLGEPPEAGAPVVQKVNNIYREWLRAESKPGWKTTMRRVYHALRNHGLRQTLIIARQRYDFRRDASHLVSRVADRFRGTK